MVKPDPKLGTMDVQFIDTHSPKHPVLLPYQTLLVTEQRAEKRYGEGARSMYAIASTRKQLELLLDFYRTTYEALPDPDRLEGINQLGHMAVWDEEKGELEGTLGSELWEATILIRDRRSN